MKIALICPHFPPDRCGVGDHTALLAQELSRTHSVKVWTAQAAPKHFSQFKITTVMPWGLRGYKRIRSELLTYSPDAVIVQFTPYLYGPDSWGLSPSLFFWLGSLRSQLKCPIILNTHELHYPVGLSPDKALVGGSQAAQFAALTVAANQVWFTYEIPLHRYRNWMPWQREKFAWIPVGANIDPDFIERPIHEKEISEALRHAKIPDRHRLFVQFGSSHPSRLFPHSFAALDLARKEFGPDSSSLVFVGLDPTAVDSILEGAGRMDLRPFTRGTGYVANWQASIWLRRADVVLAPFVDGVSTRRGSVMAALAHGTPVVTTQGVHTDPSLPWSDFTACVTGVESFAEEAVKLLRDPSEAKILGEKGKSRYVTSFSWPSIAKQMISHLERSS